MNWLTRLLAPPLALACVLALFMAGQKPAAAPATASSSAAPTSDASAEASVNADADALSDTDADAQKSLVNPPPKGLLSDWRPDVDQAIDQLERWLSDDHPQQELNYSMANLAALYDTKLYLVFIDYLASIDPSQSAAVLQEQQHWLHLRKERTATARLTYEGGSLASYNASETYVYITHERIDTLQALMQKTVR